MPAAELRYFVMILGAVKFTVTLPVSSSPSQNQVYACIRAQAEVHVHRNSRLLQCSKTGLGLRSNNLALWSTPGLGLPWREGRIQSAERAVPTEFD